MTPASNRRGRIRDHLPTTQEVGAYALFFCLVWGVLILVMLEALP